MVTFSDSRTVEVFDMYLYQGLWLFFLIVIVDSELAVRIRRRRRSRRRSVATTDKFDLFRTSFAQGYCVFMFWGMIVVRLSLYYSEIINHFFCITGNKTSWLLFFYISGIVQMFEYRRTIERDFYERFGLVYGFLFFILWEIRCNCGVGKPKN